METNDKTTLLNKAKQGNSSAMEELITGFKPLVASIARRYFIVGGETDDLIQEGMIGLFNAIQTYDESSEASFKTFATLCINRKVQTAIRSANRQKNKMLNQFVTINNQGIIVSNNVSDENYDQDDNELGVYIESKTLDPENAVISRENEDYIKTEIEKKLTILEKNVLQLFVAGKSYTLIAEELKINKKTVDNMLFRIRKKLAFLKDK